MDPATAGAMSKALEKFVNHDKPVQDMDPKAYAWLRLRAASALARMGAVGQNNSTHDALIKLIGSFKSIDDRCETASLLGRLNYEGAKIDNKAALGTICQLARDVADEEAKRAEDFEMMRTTGGAGIPYIPTTGVGGSDEEQYDPYPRKHVLARLLQLTAGLDALKKAVPEEDQKKIDAVKAAIKPVIDKGSDEKVISLRVAEAVGTMRDAVYAAAPTAEAPAADEELDF
jgi:hypothetical protein